MTNFFIGWVGSEREKARGGPGTLVGVGPPSLSLSLSLSLTLTHAPRPVTALCCAVFTRPLPSPQACERARKRRAAPPASKPLFHRRRVGVAAPRRALPPPSTAGRAGSVTAGAGSTVAAMTAARKKWVEEGTNLAAGPRESARRARAGRGGRRGEGGRGVRAGGGWGAGRGAGKAATRRAETAATEKSNARRARASRPAPARSHPSPLRFPNSRFWAMPPTRGAPAARAVSLVRAWREGGEDGGPACVRQGARSLLCCARQLERKTPPSPRPRLQWMARPSNGQGGRVRGRARQGEDSARGAVQQRRMSDSIFFPTVDARTLKMTEKTPKPRAAAHRARGTWRAATRKSIGWRGGCGWVGGRR